MSSKIFTAALCFAGLISVSLVVGCGKESTPPPAAEQTMSPEKVKLLISVLEGPSTIGPYGMDMKAGAAERLGECGQMAKDANAIPALTKLSKSPKATKLAREAATAALAKLNGEAAPAP